MGKKLYAYFTVLFAFGILPVMAQNNTNITHWMFARSNYNPAATGANKGMEFMLWDREQWVGLEGRPSSQMLNANFFVKPLHGGLGATITYDRIGFQSNLNLRVNYAYHATLNENAFLTIGVGAGFMYTNTKSGELLFANPEDPVMNNFNENKFLPDVAAGLELNHKNYIIGLSATQLIGGPTSKYPYFARGLNLYGNYSFNIKNKARLVPGLLVRSPFFTTQFEGNLLAYFLKDRVWIGAAYRFQDAISAIVGAEVIKGLRVGYSFDYSLGGARPYNTGTHEVMLMYSMKKPRKRQPFYNNPRNYFKI